ncbi:MAG: hypothetical protein IJA81_09070 [Akkermansia sp.]|nr:hypothetical protein [Akkermansia sp.]
MNTETLPENAQALRRALGDCPVVTPDALCTFAAWLLSTLKSDITALAATEGGGQQWARSSQLALRFGCKRSQMTLWLTTLHERGQVRVWRPRLPNGCEGKPYYSIADVERAWLVRQEAPPATDPKEQQKAQQWPFRRQLPPNQQAGLRAMNELKARIREESTKDEFRHTK